MTRRAQVAINAWEVGRRHRRIAAAIDRLADGVLALGGFLLLSATAGLNTGAPAGRAGVTLGTTMVCAALMWMGRARHSKTVQHREAMQVANVVPIRRAA